MVHDSLAQAMKEETYLPFDFEFRASRLPFCSRQLVLHARWPKDALPVRSERYDFGFYTRIGNVLHELIQSFLGLSGILWGHWTCCGVTVLFQEGTTNCPVCGKPRKYLEFELDSELGAHVDGVSLVFNSVFEFKTTGSATLEKLTAPYPNHQAQASCYVVILNEMFDLNLDKICFVYLSRDTPKKYKVFVRKPDKTAYADALVQFAAAQQSLYNGTIPDRVCSNSYEGHDRACPYVGVCFYPGVEEHLIPVANLVRSRTI